VAHTCNPSYSGGRDQENLSSKPAPGKEFPRPYLRKTHHKKGQSNSSSKNSYLVSMRSYVQTPVPPKKKKKKKERHEIWKLKGRHLKIGNNFLNSALTTQHIKAKLTKGIARNYLLHINGNNFQNQETTHRRGEKSVHAILWTKD
jgi:hypothetical protein